MKYNIVTWFLLVGLMLVSGVKAGGCSVCSKIGPLPQLLKKTLCLLIVSVMFLGGRVSAGAVMGCGKRRPLTQLLIRGGK
jgi:hypothetical protein